MSELQLSFLETAPAEFDVNAVDDGVVAAGKATQGSAALSLSQRSVDDWVFGLGFTNWKNVIDHAIQTGHYELFSAEDGVSGLKKHGYRYAPIPRLPAGGHIRTATPLGNSSPARSSIWPERAYGSSGTRVPAQVRCGERALRSNDQAWR